MGSSQDCWQNVRQWRVKREYIPEKCLFLQVYDVHSMHLASCLPGNHSELPDTCIINARDDEARHSRAHAHGLSVPAKKSRRMSYAKLRIAKGRKKREVIKDERGTNALEGRWSDSCRMDAEENERKDRTRERGVTSRKVVQVTDVETWDNDYFFIF